MNYNTMTLKQVCVQSVLLLCFSQHSDSQLWTVLDRCHLEHAVRQLGMFTTQGFCFVITLSSVQEPGRLGNL